jgi:hypothetical protein
MNEHCDILIEDLRNEAEKDELVHMAPFLETCALDVIAGTNF